MAAATDSEQMAPPQLAFHLHSWLSAIDAIADEHNLHHHDSGVSFSSYVRGGGGGSSSGDSRSAGSSLFSNSHRQGSGSTAKTSLSIGSVGSVGSLLVGKQSSAAVPSGAGGSTSTGMLAPPSEKGSSSGSRASQGSGASGLLVSKTPGPSTQMFSPLTSSSSNSSSSRRDGGAMLSASPSRTGFRSSLPPTLGEAPASRGESSQMQNSEGARVMESPGLTASFDAREDIWADVARRLKPFGDTLRHDRLRSILGKTSLTKNCAEMLDYSAKRNEDGPALHDAQIEMLRTLANMCIDHEGNRDICLAAHAPQAAIATVQHVLDCALHDFPLNLITLLRMAMGALNNMQLQHAATRDTLRHDTTSIEILIRLATDSRIYRVGDWYRPHDPSVDIHEWKRKILAGSHVTSTAWHLLQDVCAGDEEAQSNADDSGTRRQASSDDDESEKMFDSIVRIGATKAACYLVLPLEPYAAKAKNRFTAKGPWDGDDVADLIESDATAVQCASELIESCALDAKDFRTASLLDDSLENGPCNSHSVLEFLVRFLDVGDPPLAWSADRDDSDNLPPKPSDVEGAKEALATFARAKAAIARAIVSIVGEDENMTVLFDESDGNNSAAREDKHGWFISTMKEWMARDSKERDDLVSTAMLAIGNLARKDSHCIALVHDHELVPSLTATLQPGVDIKVAHAIVCLLKNLAIPQQNKQTIGQSNGLFARCATFFGKPMDRVQPLQFATVGLFKHLCGGCVANSLSLTVDGNTLNELLELLERTEDVPTRMEGTRALVTAIKSLWSASQGSDRPQSEADASARKQARQRLVSEPVINALAEMMRGSIKYPVLVNEGILALTLLATDRDAAANGAQMVAKSLLKDPTHFGRQQQQGKSGAAAADGAADELAKAASATPSSAPRKDADGEADPSSTRTQSSAVGSREDGSGSNSGLLHPHRQTTLDSLASNAATGMPAIRTGADMVATVLLRRDARMPPHFANNACALVQTLVQSENTSSSPTTPSPPPLSKAVAAPGAPSDSSPVKAVIKRWLSALEQLSEVGPQETLPVAQRSLRNARAFVGSEDSAIDMRS